VSERKFAAERRKLARFSELPVLSGQNVESPVGLIWLAPAYHDSSYLMQGLFFIKGVKTRALCLARRTFVTSLRATIFDNRRETSITKTTAGSIGKIASSTPVNIVTFWVVFYRQW
jgi:hypothetical protein